MPGTPLITIEEAGRFEMELVKTLDFAEKASMRLARLVSANNRDELGGFEFTAEDLAAYTLLSDALRRQVDRMQEWEEEIRKESPHLFSSGHVPSGV